DKDYRFDLEYRIAQSYHYGAEFDKAIDFYTRYKEKLAKNTSYRGKDRIASAIVDRNIYECQNGKEFLASPKKYSIVNIGGSINSDWDDYAPVLNEAEDEIVFTSRRRDGNVNQNVDTDNKPFEDIFTAKKENGKWLPAQNIGTSINTPSHDSNTALSADGKTLLICSDENAGDIFFSTRNADGTWAAPEPLPGEINSQYEEKSASLSKDGNTIYFSSNRPGGFGGIDIYKATKNKKGIWSTAKNLGPQINTEEDDDAPFIDYDGKTLYFSSRGHNGMGGYDIYKTQEDGNSWTKPENLGYPINTPDNDIFYVTSKDGKRAYYSSVRDDAFGYEDIYLITVPDPDKEPEPEAKRKIPTRYIIRIEDGRTNKVITARVKLQGAEDNILVGSTATREGIYEFKVSETKAYNLSVEAEGFMFVNETVTITGSEEDEKIVMRTIKMKPLEVGFVSVLRNLYFDFNKATFQQASYAELSKLERMLQQNATLKIEIAGHTDNVGSKNYNKILSQKRAEAVKDYLTKKGIDSRRITAVGYGSTRPLASNDDEEEGRELNRRVEFKVLSGK
ncbi:MAG TPA: OmpA family protein, partial [Cyclobacteriaceae bacterium]|nr:OmpA family protein [Cyclobacteriaceae bacterium]